MIVMVMLMLVVIIVVVMMVVVLMLVVIIVIIVVLVVMGLMLVVIIMVVVMMSAAARFSVLMLIFVLMSFKLLVCLFSELVELSIKSLVGFHDFEHLSSRQLIPVSCNDLGSLVESPDILYNVVELCCRHSLLV